ncbi:MAG: hypothetical protein FWH15_05900 [Betaproteobacteria bacterium]|nr:hypothetical protein [Betaproteobacteria bacterium]
MHKITAKIRSLALFSCPASDYPAMYLIATAKTTTQIILLVLQCSMKWAFSVTPANEYPGDEDGVRECKG